MSISTRAGGRPRSTDVDAAILNVALTLFIEGGLAAVTFEQIAKRSGVSRTAIYRRWRSREELIAQALAALRERAEEAFSDWAERPLSEVLDWFIDNVPRQMLDPAYRSLTRNVLSLGDDSPLKAIYAEQVLRPRREAFTRMIEKARADGVVAEGLDPEMMQDIITGALFHQLLLGGDQPSETEIRSYIVRLLTNLGLLSARL